MIRSSKAIASAGATAFGVNSGLLNSLPVSASAAPGTVQYPSVPTQMMVDLGFNYRLGFAGRPQWSLNVSNALDNQVATFAGTAKIGRMLITRIKFDF